MLGALLYLRLTSFRNGLLSRLRRLRQPKYLIGAIVGFAYLWFFFFRPMGAVGAPRHSPGEALALAEAATGTAVLLPADWVPLSTAIGALALLVFFTLMWVIPTERAALGFTEAEIAFLFPAPITRRGLVHFQLLSTQFRSLAGATIMMLFSHRWTFLGGNALTHALGWWFVFSALNLHLNGARFTLTRLADGGLGLWPRRVAVLALVGAVIAVTVWRMPAGAPPQAPGADPDLRPITDWLLALSNTAPLTWLLWPFRFVVGPFLAPDAVGFFLALGPALAVLGLHYYWVVRAVSAFEDSSIDAAQKRAARIAAWRSGQSVRSPGDAKPQRPPFALAGTGRPELAFLWKNLLSTWPWFTGRVFLGCAAVIVAAGLWLGSQPLPRGVLPGIGAMAVMFAAYTLIVGPQFARQDIRSDLANADILKTYPLAGWQIVLGELLAPTAILTGILWLALLAAGITFQPTSERMAWLTPGLRVALTAALALLAPALAALQLLVPNAAALVFPGWFQASRTRGGGPEMIGQRMIFFFAQLLTMLFALLPAAALGAALVFIFQWLVGAVAAVCLTAVAVLAILVAEVWCGIWLLGQQFERLEISAENRA